jgi:CDP-diacylglycerol--glycerol-3-phosphate 3-phosphatidyltransferase
MKNVPNILSVIRAILSIAVLVLIVIVDPAAQKMAFIFGPGLLFLIAAVTDTLDGQIARRKNLVSDFGKFIDPIADKILTTFAVLGFLYIDADGGRPILLINLAVTLLREFSIASLRMMAAKGGVTISASIYGKLKTTVQMTALIILLFNLIVDQSWLGILGQIALYLALALTIFSGADYLIKGYQKVIKRTRK